MPFSFDGVPKKLRVLTRLRGHDLLRHSLLNKGTSFTAKERRELGLEGLLPSSEGDIELQVERAYRSILEKTTPIERYIGLASLQDRNETLFYRLLLAHTEELTPIVYTPTVGEACQRYSHIYRRARGIWITPDHRGRIESVLANAAGRDLRLIVCTDNERILGLGDLGAGGIGIPIGKLALYTIGAGIHPSKTLAISLDVGTDNPELLDDPFYIGFRQRRLRGPEYDSLVEEFVQAVKAQFPRALLQWEDFKKGIAFDLLDRYRDVLLSFNDDIQGTAGVALAGVMAACRAKGARLGEQRIVILGGGAAGIGIARQLRDGLARDGVAGDALRSAIAIVDSKGLIVQGRSDGEKHKEEFAWPPALADAARIPASERANLGAIVAALGATVLIGTSGQPGIFDERVVRAMSKSTERPVIFPLSNPTSQSEARPAEVLEWSEGRALVATGSPFGPATRGGVEHRFSQANNVYVFPGVGLGALVAEAKGVTDSMFTVAARELAAAVPAADLERGLLFPPLTELRSVTAKIAAAVVREARDLGIGRAIDDAAVEAEVDEAMWFPDYPEIVGA